MSVALYSERPAAAQHGDDYFSRWGYDGTLEKIHYTLYVKCREQDESEASPTACIVDSQSVKSAEKGGSASMPMDSMPAS